MGIVRCRRPAQKNAEGGIASVTANPPNAKVDDQT